MSCTTWRGVANLLANQKNDELDDEVDFDQFPACRRLHLNTDSCSDIVSASEEKIKELRQALGV